AQTAPTNPAAQGQKTKATAAPQNADSSHSDPVQSAYEKALQARQAADAAIKEALESGDGEALDKAYAARKLADKNLADAALKKQAATKSQEEAAQKPKRGKSLIPTDPAQIKALAKSILDKIIGWLTSAAFLAMIGVIILSWILSPILARMLKKRIPLLRAPPAADAKLRIVRHYLYEASNLLRPVLLVGLLAGGAAMLKAVPMFGQDWLVRIAQGLAVVFLLFKAIKQFIKNPLFQKITIWVTIPLALLMVFGYYDDLLKLLNGTTVMSMGGTPITLMTLVRLAIFGALFFWLGGISNSRGQTAIRSQESLDLATREVVAKLFQILLFVILVVLVLSFAGIPLSGLVMIFSAVGLGIGFGLQPIAANFISGLIILFDRTVKVGDYVVLPDGQEGFVDAINMRNTMVETTDGKDVMVPNVTFIDNTYENWTHKDPRQRYEVYFSVAYDTDIEKLEDILIPEISKHKSVLQEPEKPDLELREFGENGIKFAIEFWCSGIDDGENKFTSDLNYIVWRALKKHGIRMPFPQRDVHIVSGHLPS
ncbi:MAG TPA: mechanosensitive ion channel, partial [Hellea balneolensis]|nr:mechanosensitive ion channel [Hellea balneolensis]